MYRETKKIELHKIDSAISLLFSSMTTTKLIDIIAKYK